jgi:C7-cyclitol 7-kinase
MPAIVYDVGGTHLRRGIARDGRLTDAKSLRITDATITDPEPVIWHRVTSALAQFAADQPDDLPIVISFAGPIDEAGRVLSAPTLLGAPTEGFDLARVIHAKTGRRVHVLNDVSAAAWAASEQVGVRRFMVVTVSSSIGSKIFDRDRARPVVDDVAYAGEIGHARVDHAVDAVLCDCGGRGHLGAMASGRGIERRARQRAVTDPAGFARSLCVTRFGASAETLSNERHLVPAARATDDWTLEVIADGTRLLANMLATCVFAGGIEHVRIIGGFASALGGVYLDILRAALRRATDYKLLETRLPTLVSMAEPGEETCLLGAAVYARRVLGEAAGGWAAERQREVA